MTWKSVKLGNIAKNIQTGPFGSQLHQSDYSDVGTPVIMPKDIANGKISEVSIARVSNEHVERLSKHRVELGDILYSRRGDVGRCAYADSNNVGWLCGTGCLRVTIDSQKANPKFIFYALQLPECIGWVINHAVGSTMLNLNTSIIGDIPLSVPSLRIQNIIVKILSAYDDLIENNQKQIKLLEEAAQRLYKEWFIDLHFPGHEDCKIVDGVPEGWRNGFLNELIEVNYGKDHKKVPNNGNIPVYGSGGLIRKCNKSLFEGEAVLIPRKGSLNNIMYVNEAFWTVDTMFYATMKYKETAIYVYNYLKQYDMYSMNIGAAVPSMTVKILNSMDILIPNQTLLSRYYTVAKKYFDENKLLHKTIELTQEARDRLLPKLMSGEIKL